MQKVSFWTWKACGRRAVQERQWCAYFPWGQTQQVLLKLLQKGKTLVSTLCFILQNIKTILNTMIHDCWKPSVLKQKSQHHFSSGTSNTTEYLFPICYLFFYRLPDSVHGTGARSTRTQTVATIHYRWRMGAPAKLSSGIEFSRWTLWHGELLWGSTVFSSY